MYCRPSYSNFDQHSAPKPKPRQRHRRYLDDPIDQPATNYYIIEPSSSDSIPISTPIPLPRQLKKLSKENDDFCDLFNLLDRTPPPIKPRRSKLNERTPPRPQRSIDSIRQRKSFEDKEQLTSIDHHHYQKLNDNEQNHSFRFLWKKRTFFKRVAQHYFCLPMTINEAQD